MRKSFMAVLTALVLTLPSSAFAAWNANPIHTSQLYVTALEVSETQPNLYRVFVTFDRVAYPHGGTSLCGRPLGADTPYRVYGYGGAAAIDSMVSTLTAAQLSHRRVAVLFMDNICATGYPSIAGVSLLD